ncbi:MAG: adenylate kinase [Thermoproteota archaeon]|nr:adenylate kinase [Thermoproteota archaeon]
MRLLLASVPGGGKSTVLQLVKKRKPNVTIKNFGDFMFDLAKEKYNIQDRDDMRKLLSIDERRKLQYEAAEKLAKFEHVIIDSHVAVKTSKGFYPGFPEDVLQKLHFDIIVLMEFRPEDVMYRRNLDVDIKAPRKTAAGTVAQPRGKRDVETLEEIEFHQQINRMFGASAAQQSKCNLKVINLRFAESKSFEHAKVAAKEIIKLLEP